MQLIRGLHNLKSQFVHGSVVTIGNYDGVHLGHQELLILVKQKAQELQLPSVVVLFEPQPEEFFIHDRSWRLTSIREKLRLLTQAGIDQVLLLPFNPQLAALAASQFIEKILIQALHARYIVVGDDFAFGHRREGDFSLLKKMAAHGGFQVIQLPSFKIDGVRVSSSLIRTALKADNLALATKFLGRPYRVTGRVVYGEQLGGNLGFPTANIHLGRRELPFTGVYLVKIYDLTPTPLWGLANVGFRPTVGGRQKTFEVYILNFNSNIYRKRISVEFISKIREERKFDSLAELQLQIRKDLATILG